MILPGVAKIILNQNKTLEFLTADDVSVNGIVKPSSAILGLDNMIKFNSKDEDFSVDCRTIELVARKSPDGTIGYSHVYTPISEISTDAAATSARAAELYDDVLKNILVPCCSSGPSVIYGAVAVYPTSSDFPAEGDSGTIYIDDSEHIAYYWNGASYSMLNNNVLFYPDHPSFPIIGEANILYIDQATPAVYIWTGSAYVIVAGGSSGTIAWGDITGTITTQTDLISYLGSNYYPLGSNPAGYVTSGALAAYIPLAGTVPGSPITGALEFTSSEWLFKGDPSTILYHLTDATSDTNSFGPEVTSPTYYGSAGVDPSSGAVYLNSQQVGGDRIRFYIDSAVLLARIEMPSTAAGLQYGSDHSATYTNRSLVDKEYVINAIAAIGTAAWGSIGAGTGVATQADLVSYLGSNYYPLSANPAGYLTALSASALYYPLSANPAGYLTTSSAGALYYPLSSNPSNYLTSISAGALYYPLSSNPSGYLTSSSAGALYYPLSSNPAGYLTSSSIPSVWPISAGGTNSGTALSNNRVMKSAGGAIVEAAAITSARVLISDANGIPTHSAVTSTTLGYLDATSSVQTQINNLNSYVLAPFKSNTDIIHTGSTAEVKVFSQVVLAGTISANDMIDYVIKFTPSATANAKTIKVYFNTSDSLSGATLFATYGGSVAATRYAGFQRKIVFKNSLSSQQILLSTQATVINEDTTTTVVSETKTQNFAVDQYFIVSVQLANSGDTVTINSILSKTYR